MIYAHASRPYSCPDFSSTLDQDESSFALVQLWILKKWWTHKNGALVHFLVFGFYMSIFGDKYFLETVILLHSFLHVIDHKLRKSWVSFFVFFVVIWLTVYKNHTVIVINFRLDQVTSFWLRFCCLICPAILRRGHWLINHNKLI